MDDEIRKILRRPKKWSGKPPSPLQPQWRKNLKKIPEIEGEPEIESPEEKQPPEPDDWCCAQTKKYFQYLVYSLDNLDPEGTVTITTGTGKVKERLYTVQEKAHIAQGKAKHPPSIIPEILNMDCDEFIEYMYNGVKEAANAWMIDFGLLQLFYEECKEDGYQGTAEQWHTKDNWLWGDIPRSDTWDLVKSEDTISKKIRQWHKKLDKWMAEHNDWKTAAQCMEWFNELGMGRHLSKREISAYLNTRKHYEVKLTYFRRTDTQHDGSVNEYRIITDIYDGVIEKASPITRIKIGSPKMRTKLKPIPEREESNCREELKGIIRNISKAKTEAEKIVEGIRAHWTYLNLGRNIGEKPLAKVMYSGGQRNHTGLDLTPLDKIPEEVCCQLLKIIKEFSLDVGENDSVHDKYFFGRIRVHGKDTNYWARIGPFYNKGHDIWNREDEWDPEPEDSGYPDGTMYQIVNGRTDPDNSDPNYSEGYGLNMGFGIHIWHAAGEIFYREVDMLARYSVGVMSLENVLVKFSNKLRWW